MTSKETIIQIAKMIASGKIPNALYDEYLSECPIGFMGEKELIEFLTQDLERLELIETLYNESFKRLTIKNDDRELYLKRKTLEKDNKLLDETMEVDDNILQQMIIKNQGLKILFIIKILIAFILIVVFLVLKWAIKN